MPLARSAIQIAAMALAAALLAQPGPAGAQTLRPYAIVGDAIPDSLTTREAMPRAGARWSSIGQALASSATAAHFRN